jgi:PKD repeat protein
MVLSKFIGTPNSGVYPLVVSFTNLSLNADEYLWDFGDGYTSTEEHPTHAYSEEGPFTVSLTATNSSLAESETVTKTNYIHPFSNYYRLNKHLSNSEISDEVFKICSPFLTIGWIKSPKFKNGEYLIPLAVEDRFGNLLESNKSIKFMLLREDKDYRFVYNNSQSVLINKSIGINLEDDNWHFLMWSCTGDSGSMSYSVDLQNIPVREGVDLSGLSYSKAYSQETRIGGGRVWAPYLYAEDQSLVLFNWRFGKNLSLPEDMINEIVSADKEYLGI